MSAQTADHRPVWGLVAFFVAAIGLIAVTLHISDVFSEPEQSAATSIGEFAAEIRQSASRALSGDPAPAPAPPDRSWTADLMLALTGTVLAGIATILGAIGLFRREAPALPTAAIVMGCSAFLMQYVFYLALLIAGICLMVAILNNLGDILGG